jgi:deazaflavin-dependent oxidoreductase (nitroreductase family)
MAKKNRLVQTPHWFAWFFSTLHRGAYRLSGGRLGTRFRGEPAILLTTTGRRTGEPRTWPLLALREGDAYIVAASNGGHDRHPAWYLNLEADPEVTIQDGKRTVPGRARVTTGAERTRLYDRFVETMATYRDYEEATDRPIPVVVIAPAPNGAPGAAQGGQEPAGGPG